MQDGALLVRQVRLVPVDPGGMPGLIPPGAARRDLDVRIRAGVITEVGPDLAHQGEPELHGEGRFAIPGLWDQHVHLGQWAATADRLDLRDTAGPQEVLSLVAAALPAAPGPEPLIGFGFRSVTWSEPASVAALDRLTGDRPVALISGDAHSGWVNSAAQSLLDLPRREDLFTENEWFSVMPRLNGLPGAAERTRSGLRRALAQAHARGVVGIVDLEWEPNHLTWPARVRDGLDTMRVRVGVYPDRLPEVLAAGLRTGQPLDPGGLVEMGPLKVISDGSLGTRTAYCRHPYRGTNEHGSVNQSPAELTGLLRRATAGGLQVAVHAIGDAAAGIALEAIEASGARGSIEHAQLLSPADIHRMARLGLTASVQPAHLREDRELIEACWPDRAGQCFALASLRSAGVRLMFGSDAPVSPLDPWTAIAWAVTRTGDGRPAWHPEESLTVAEALAASTDGQGTLHPGGRGDLVLLDTDPLAPDTADAGGADDVGAVARQLDTIPVAATIVAGRIVHLR